MKYITILLFLLFSCHSILNAQDYRHSYVSTKDYLDSYGSRRITTVQYVDDYGRPEECATNALSDDGNYSYTYTEYDASGRVMRNWLPLATSNTNPDYIRYSYVQAGSSSTYNDGHAYSQKQYDALGRTIYEAIPGDSWYANNKGNSHVYFTNTSGNVNKYTYQDDGIGLAQEGYWHEGTLSGERSIDADGKITETYKDLNGNLILERRDMNNDTYYVYDNNGYLRAVLPPKCQEVGIYNLSCIYRYDYNKYGKCCKKILPGCDSIIYKYDMYNRIAFMQDGRMRLTGTYRFFLYDELGRLAIQGLCNNMPANIEHLVASVGYETGSDEVCNTGYCLNTGYNLLDAQIEIVNYYDTYSFLGNNSVQNYYINGADLSGSNSTNAYSMLTGQIIATSNGEYLCSALYYDNKCNLIDKRETILGGGILSTATTYTFTNKPETITEILTKNGLTRTVVKENSYNNVDKLLTQTHKYGSRATVTTANYSYNNVGLLDTFRQCDGNVVTNYEYDVHGWLTHINTHTSADVAPRYEEIIHYADGPGTPYFNGNISCTKFVTNTDSTNSDAFHAYKYSYDGLNRMTNAIYGSGSMGMSDYSDTDIYSEYLTYDANSNITSLVRRGNKIGGTNVIIDDLTYEYVFGENRLLSITDKSEPVYTFGRLNFKDNKISSHGFPEYGYDKCGAITYDTNKGITKIDYDFNGNPTRIQFANRNVIEYVYSADCRRLKTVHRTSVNQTPYISIGSTYNLSAAETQSVDSTEYIGDFVYANRILSRCEFDGGYLGAPLLPSCYRFYIKDHLGSNRMVVGTSGNVLQNNAYFAYGGLTDASNSPGIQSFKYNGKEYDTMHGLNEYDYGARQYDPAIAQFTSMDPLCEKYYHISPYAYCGGNPVNRVDPDGKAVKIHYIDLKGRCRMFVYRDTGQNKIKIPKSRNDFVKKFVRAYLFNKTNYINHFQKGKTGLMNLVQSEDAKVNVVQTTNGNSYYNQSKTYQGRIDGFVLGWDPNHASKFKSGVRISPATILAHEGDHANDQSRNMESCQLHIKRLETPDDQYDNAEEKRVITGDEQKQAEANGEITPGQQTRFEHEGEVYWVDDPLKR